MDATTHQLIAIFIFLWLFNRGDSSATKAMLKYHKVYCQQRAAGLGDAEANRAATKVAYGTY